MGISINKACFILLCTCRSFTNDTEEAGEVEEKEEKEEEEKKKEKEQEREKEWSSGEVVEPPVVIKETPNHHLYPSETDSFKLVTLSTSSLDHFLPPPIQTP